MTRLPSSYTVRLPPTAHEPGAGNVGGFAVMCPGGDKQAIRMPHMEGNVSRRRPSVITGPPSPLILGNRDHVVGCLMSILWQRK
jgi:hypothetical protein